MSNKQPNYFNKSVNEILEEYFVHLRDGSYYTTDIDAGSGQEAIQQILLYRGSRYDFHAKRLAQLKIIIKERFDEIR